MNELELEKKLLDLGVDFNAKTFKPNAVEIAVFEQLIDLLQKDEVPKSAGVLLAPNYPEPLKTIKQI
jgi:hypothetical protein